MRKNVKDMTRIAVLGAIGAVLFLIPGVPIIPPIYKLDFSTLPVLLAGFSMGPISGVLVALVKDLIGFITSDSMGIGELADFLACVGMVIPAALIYRHRRSFKGALLALCVGVLCSTLIATLCNWLLLIPFYANAFHMPIDNIVSMIAKVIPPIHNLPTLLLLATAPFNLLKGVVLSLMTLLLYKRLSFLLKDAK